MAWEGIVAGRRARSVALPTYAFQRRRYWLEAHEPAGSPAVLGLDSASHPLLATATELPDGSHLFTGRVTLTSHAWLSDHIVMGTVILPGTAFIELALHAAQTVGLDEVAELVLNTPMTFSSEDAALLQVVVGPEGSAGGRSLTIRVALGGGPLVDAERDRNVERACASSRLTSGSGPRPGPRGASTSPAPIGAGDVDVG